MALLPSRSRPLATRARALVALGAVGLAALSAAGPAASCWSGAPPQAQAAAHGRRLLLASSVLALAPGAAPRAALAAAEQENQFSVELPDSGWKLKKEMRQAIRVKKEVVFDAADTKGAQVVITRGPLGADANQQDFREKIMDLAGAFDAKSKNKLPKEQVVSILTSSFDDPKARRARQIMEVERGMRVEEYTGPGGQRYVTFSYEARECTGPVTEYTNGEGKLVPDCDGKKKPRTRHVLAATVLPTRYTAQRETTMSRFLESLWLLDASAPVASADQAGLEAIAKSFSVSLVENTEVGM